MLKCLDAAVDQDLGLAVPVSDALERLPLTATQRRAAVDGMLARLTSVEPCDVAAVAFYVLRECQPGEHALAVSKVRPGFAWHLVERVLCLRGGEAAGFCLTINHAAMQAVLIPPCMSVTSTRTECVEHTLCALCL